MHSGVMLARPARGVVGEAERVCHVFPIPDSGVPDEITALCGASFGPGQLERLDGPAGMPCEGCLGQAAESPSRSLARSVPLSDDTVASRLDVIERTLDELERQLDGLRAAVSAILDDQRRDGR
ncbi:hypothetical protein BAY59_27720 [Prauserella coralliicola]|nr:hypothetical protein BAY59_27720 [Prauserella coralliicola]